MILIAQEKNLEFAIKYKLYTKFCLILTTDLTRFRKKERLEREKRKERDSISLCEPLRSPIHRSSYSFMLLKNASAHCPALRIPSAPTQPRRPAITKEIYCERAGVSYVRTIA